MKEKLPFILLLGFFIFWLILAFNPLNYRIWFAENIPVLTIVLLLVFSYKKFSFSNGSLIIAFITFCYALIGGHFSFNYVPFAKYLEFLNPERNNFDRLGHFLLGMLSYPVAEFVERKKILTKRFYILFFSFCFLLTIGTMYEIFELLLTYIFNNQDAQDFLGFQGDPLDTNWDMLMNATGAIFSLILYSIFFKEKKEKV